MSDELGGVLGGRPALTLRPRTFRPGDTVRIRSGAFASLTGRIGGINQGRRLPKVRVEIFGRETQIKLDLAEVETVSFE